MLNVEASSRPSLADVLKHKWIRESEELARRRAGSWTLGMPLTVTVTPDPPAAMSMMCASDLKKQNFFKRRFLKLLVH